MYFSSKHYSSIKIFYKTFIFAKRFILGTKSNHPCHYPLYCALMVACNPLTIFAASFHFVLYDSAQFLVQLSLFDRSMEDMKRSAFDLMDHYLRLRIMKRMRKMIWLKLMSSKLSEKIDLSRALLLDILDI